MKTRYLYAYPSGAGTAVVPMVEERVLASLTPADRLKLADAKNGDEFQPLHGEGVIIVLIDPQVKDSFQNGECPDCGESIPDEAEDGDDCTNCGHVFWSDDYMTKS